MDGVGNNVQKLIFMLPELIKKGFAIIIPNDNHCLHVELLKYPKNSNTQIDAILLEGFKNSYLPIFGHTPTSIPSLLQKREVGLQKKFRFTLKEKSQIGINFLPSHETNCEEYGSRMVLGSYFKKEDIFIAVKDGSHALGQSDENTIYMFDTSRPHYELRSTLRPQILEGNISDMDLSPDGSMLAFCTRSSILNVCDLHQNMNGYPIYYSSAVSSLKYCPSDFKLLVGFNNSDVHIRDLIENKDIIKFKAHSNTVNCVAYSDDSPHVFFTCSEDNLCNIWDQRTLTSYPQPVGMFLGHLAGITHMETKGDGRYIITNSRDQSIKLWDMRSFSPERLICQLKLTHLGCYELEKLSYPRKLNNETKKIEGDTSLMTFRGHTVLQTKVRSHFSPLESTGQKYIYTGCDVGRVVVYDALTGETAKVLKAHESCVRDVGWHTYRPELMTASWDGTLKQWCI